MDAATKIIPLFEPNICGNEWDYVKDCLDTNWVSSVGSYVDRFEGMTAELAGKKRGVAMVNGTAALHIALQLVGVGPNDEVLLSTLTFIAPANAVRYLGAHPIFIDAEPDFWQMDVHRAIDFLENGCAMKDGELRNKTTGRRVAAVVPIDVLGHPMDFDPLAKVARKLGIPIVEDASEGLGAKYRGNPVGARADITCFSFNGNKLVTTGGGGVLTTDDDALADRAKFLTTQAKADRIEYIHNEVAYNYRLTNVLAAIGVAQLEKLETHVARKREIAKHYARGLDETPGITPMPEAPWAESTFWMYTVLVDEKGFGMDCRALLAKLEERGVMTRPLWQPMHRSPAHMGAVALGGKVADQLYATALNLPSSTNLSDADLERVVSEIRALAGTPSK